MIKPALVAATSALAIASMAFSVPVQAQIDPMIGQMAIVGFNFCPSGWAPANGQLVPIAENEALFALIGTTYGGDGVSAFALPDLRGRSMVHQGTSSSITLVLGEQGGTEGVTLSAAQMPAHTHAMTMRVSRFAGNVASPSQAYLAQLPAGVTGYLDGETPANFLKSDAIAVGSAGGNQPFAIRDPYLTMNICIALEGIFPSRN